MALAYLVAGIGEAAARLSSALAGLGLSLAHTRPAGAGSSARHGLLAGTIVATSFGYFSIAPLGAARPAAGLLHHVATWALFEAT